MAFTVENNQVQLCEGDYVADGSRYGVMVHSLRNPARLIVRGLARPHTGRPLDDFRALVVVPGKSVQHFLVRFTELAVARREPISAADSELLLAWRLGGVHKGFIELTRARASAFGETVFEMGWPREQNDLMFFVIFGRRRL